MRTIPWLLIVLAGTEPSFAQEWVEVTAPAGGFTAEFPAQPTETTQLLETDAGRIPHTTVMSELAGGQVAFGVVYSDYPQAILEVPPQELLQDVRDTAAQNLQGMVIAESELVTELGPAREFSITGDVQGQPLFYHSRVILVGSRLYELRIVRVGQTPVDLADSVRFFSSFEMLPEDATTPAPPM
jgi:hypothetical protein